MEKSTAKFKLNDTSPISTFKSPTNVFVLVKFLFLLNCGEDISISHPAKPHSDAKTTTRKLVGVNERNRTQIRQLPRSNVIKSEIATYEHLLRISLRDAMEL